MGASEIAQDGRGVARHAAPAEAEVLDGEAERVRRRRRVVEPLVAIWKLWHPAGSVDGEAAERRQAQHAVEVESDAHQPEDIARAMVSAIPATFWTRPTRASD